MAAGVPGTFSMAQNPTQQPERPPLTVAVTPAGDGAAQVRLGGELDMQSVPILEEATAAVPAGGRLVLDLRELAFIDSSGIAALLRLEQRLRPDGGGVRCLVAREGPVRRVVDLTQLDELIEVAEGPPA